MGTMIRRVMAFACIAATAPAIGFAHVGSLPPLPDWQTDSASCSWDWREGGGIGLWVESCDFNGSTWQVVWDEGRAAFVTRNDDSDMGIAVQAFALPTGAGISAFSEMLVATGDLAQDAACTWQAMDLRPAPRTMKFFVLAPTDPAALAPAPSGDIPEPVCGPYGASTHGKRYFITDLRWPERAIFVEEGQERPLFAPMSVTLLP